MLLIAVSGSVYGLKALNVQAEEIIYIRNDGTIDPSGTPISTIDKVTYTFMDNIYSPIVVDRGNIVIDGNGYILQGTGTGSGFSLYGVSNVSIKNTNIKGFYFGICLNLTSNNVISENTITANTRGLIVSTSSMNTIYRNNITASTRYSVLLENSSSRNVILENNISSLNFGVWLVGACNNTLCKNNVTSNLYGIILENSYNNTLLQNDVSNNKYGVLFSESSGNVVSANTIAFNENYGIALSKASNNTFYHNNLIDNGEQLSFYESPVNVWDSGYPSGGNYWSDYRERYSNALEIDDSGIWNTPYVIDASNADTYPLMSQYVIPEFPSFLILPLFMIATLLAVIVYRRRHSF